MMQAAPDRPSYAWTIIVRAMNDAPAGAFPNVLRTVLVKQRSVGYADKETAELKVHPRRS